MNTKNHEILEAFQFRYACKKFNAGREIPKEDFFTILEAGRLSPSSFGFEPWKFLILKNQTLKDRLFPVAAGGQNSLRGASLFVIYLARKKIDLLPESPYISHMMKDVEKLPDAVIKGKRDFFSHFQKDDFDLLDGERPLFDWACKQTYIAMANMMTAAALLKIDSCPIEGFNRAAAEKILIDEGILDPVHFGISVMAGFGYRDEVQPVKTRLPASEVIEEI